MHHLALIMSERHCTANNFKSRGEREREREASWLPKWSVDDELMCSAGTEDINPECRDSLELAY